MMADIHARRKATLESQQERERRRTKATVDQEQTKAQAHAQLKTNRMVAAAIAQSKVKSKKSISEWKRREHQRRDRAQVAAQTQTRAHTQVLDHHEALVRSFPTLRAQGQSRHRSVETKVEQARGSRLDKRAKARAKRLRWCHELVDDWIHAVVVGPQDKVVQPDRASLAKTQVRLDQWQDGTGVFGCDHENRDYHELHHDILRASHELRTTVNALGEAHAHASGEITSFTWPRLSRPDLHVSISGSSSSSSSSIDDISRTVARSFQLDWFSPDTICDLAAAAAAAAAVEDDTETQDHQDKKNVHHHEWITFGQQVQAHQSKEIKTPFPEDVLAHGIALGISMSSSSSSSSERGWIMSNYPKTKRQLLEFEKHWLQIHTSSSSSSSLDMIERGLQGKLEVPEEGSLEALAFHAAIIVLEESECETREERDKMKPWSREWMDLSLSSNALFDEETLHVYMQMIAATATAADDDDDDSVSRAKHPQVVDLDTTTTRQEEQVQARDGGARRPSSEPEEKEKNPEPDTPLLLLRLAKYREQHRASLTRVQRLVHEIQLNERSRDLLGMAKTLSSQYQDTEEQYAQASKAAFLDLDKTLESFRQQHHDYAQHFFELFHPTETQQQYQDLLKSAKHRNNNWNIDAFECQLGDVCDGIRAQVCAFLDEDTNGTPVTVVVPALNLDKLWQNLTRLLACQIQYVNERQAQVQVYQTQYDDDSSFFQTSSKEEEEEDVVRDEALEIIISQDQVVPEHQKSFVSMMSHWWSKSSSSSFEDVWKKKPSSLWTRHHVMKVKALYAFGITCASTSDQVTRDTRREMDTILTQYLAQEYQQITAIVEHLRTLEKTGRRQQQSRTECLFVEEWTPTPILPLSMISCTENMNTELMTALVPDSRMNKDGGHEDQDQDQDHPSDH